MRKCGRSHENISYQLVHPTRVRVLMSEVLPQEVEFLEKGKEAKRRRKRELSLSARTISALSSPFTTRDHQNYSWSE